ncbi:hypothetical protein ACFVT1_31285 [Streptomyces sp. NPDC057963]|uniref:hypothetical protein n=1 Tax=Streptomyces sp. NPDC057963 TaxID=3346290 RepID=UPI0036E654FA
MAVPVLALASTTSASASTAGNVVSWKNVATGKCLNWSDYWATQNPKAMVGGCDTGFTQAVSNWREVPVDGKYWTFRTTRIDQSGNGDNLCLTSYNTLVYLETCQNGNWWQQWEEIWTENGWKLQHRGDGWVKGFFLDTDGSRLYTEPPNKGMNQVWN